MGSVSPEANGNASPSPEKEVSGDRGDAKGTSPSPAPANGARSPDDRSPVRRSESPKRLSRSPSRSRSRSRERVARRSRSRSRSRDRRLSRSPVRRSRSPVRRRSRSPVRRYSRSPVRRRSRSADRYDRYRRSPPRRDYPPPSYGRRSPPRRRTPPRTGLHMFVAGLNFITTERELERKFERYGKVTEARIVKNPRTGESRGFGFVALDHDDEVDKAIRHLDGTEWNGRVLLVERARNVR